MFNVQLEILKAFSFDLDEEELKNFKDVIARYFANKAWDKKGFTDKYVDKILNTKMRKSKD
ncbi:MAG: hypothetical protein WD048_00240 [Chitinophagales bacterium]